MDIKIIDWAMTLDQIVELGLQILDRDHINTGLFFHWVLSFEQRVHLCMSFHNICPEYIVSMQF